jgi:hypothetical protein
MRILAFVLAIPFLAGVKSLGDRSSHSNLLLFNTCATCIQPCIYGDPSSHETIANETGNKQGPAHGCDASCDCTCHVGCMYADDDLINNVFLASEAGDGNALSATLRKLHHKAHVNRARGVLQFERCEGVIGAQLPLSSDLIRVAESALSD